MTKCQNGACKNCHNGTDKCYLYPTQEKCTHGEDTICFKCGNPTPISIEQLLKEERNAVLSEVEREVEKRKQQEKEAKPAGEIEKIDERAYCAACDDISTIITNLRIKQ